MHHWQWVDDHRNCKQEPDKRPQCRGHLGVKISATDLAESKPETVGERGEQESGDLEEFAVVYAGKNIELWY